MVKAIYVEGWKCRSCKQIFDNTIMADECCKNGNVYDKMINLLFNGRPTLQELKDLTNAIRQRMKKLSDY